jgi:hypothetical protein
MKPSDALGSCSKQHAGQIDLPGLINVILSESEESLIISGLLAHGEQLEMFRSAQHDNAIYGMALSNNPYQSQL